MVFFQVSMGSNRSREFAGLNASPTRQIRSAIILPVALSYILHMVLLPGFVIFSAFSDSLILGTNRPVPLSLTAASLYTPPKEGQSLAVIKLVPTPQELMAAPCIFRELIRFSSRSLEAEMTASEKPASSSIFLAFLER